MFGEEFVGEAKYRMYVDVDAFSVLIEHLCRMSCVYGAFEVKRSTAPEATGFDVTITSSHTQVTFVNVIVELLPSDDDIVTSIKLNSAVDVIPFNSWGRININRISSFLRDREKEIANLYIWLCKDGLIFAGVNGLIYTIVSMVSFDEMKQPREVKS